ncbi:ATP-grasp domain-containing protein [Facklamia sp. P12955]|uniref:ATP-grasp domain-containing protein n=1 Tax=Facklamia sp. P12955 TaxID=3421946 RepID=UPI003D17398E
MKNNRLLILGAGRGQIGLYKAAQKLGYHVIAGTLEGDNLPCLEFADEVAIMDISDPSQVEKKSEFLNINGIATCCLDTGIQALGRVCDSLNLIGLSEDSAIKCNNKLQMKQALIEDEVSTAKFFKISSRDQLIESFSNLEFPVVVKATDLQGSRGVYICNSKNEAMESFAKVMQETDKDYCIIEEFIEGLEFGAQSFVFNDEILFVMPHGDETYMSHTAVPIGHYVPFEDKDKLFDQINYTVRKAIKALNLNNCAVNVDLILRDNKVYIIELTGRVGANCLPELVEINYSIDYYKMIAKMAMGDSPKEIWNNRSDKETAGLARMIIETEKSGEINEIKYNGNLSNNIREVTFFKQKGDEIRKFVNSSDCIGQVVVCAETIKGCEDEIRKVFDNINVEINKH